MAPVVAGAPGVTISINQLTNVQNLFKKYCDLREQFKTPLIIVVMLLLKKN